MEDVMVLMSACSVCRLFCHATLNSAMYVHYMLKGRLHKIFDFRFFSPTSFPLAPEYSVSVYRRVNDTDNKLFTGANDTGN